MTLLLLLLSNYKTKRFKYVLLLASIMTHNLLTRIQMSRTLHGYHTFDDELVKGLGAILQPETKTDKVPENFPQDSTLRCIGSFKHPDLGDERYFLFCIGIGREETEFYVPESSLVEKANHAVR
jgi:hypothetical protein